jgi:predicted membrane chloride channel (bestrophin family)
MRLSEVNGQLLNENREMKRRAQESLVEKAKEEQSRSVAAPANIEEMNLMAEQIRKLRRQLRSSQVAAKQLQGENQLLKDVTESVSQRPSSHSLKSVLLMDESFQLLL